MKKLVLLTLFCSLAIEAIATTNDGWNEYMTVFKNGTIDNPYNSKISSSYRIPGITSTSQGTLIAVSDIRYAGQHGNTDIVDNKNNVHPVKISIKVSHDGGTSWNNEEILGPSTGNGFITDPAIVHNNRTGTTFLFGYQNDKHLTSDGGNNKFFVFSSNDGGKTWDKGKEIQNDISLGDGYKYTLQGPGSGLFLDGKIYMAVQGFKPTTTNPNEKWSSISGYIYSEDNGQSWKTVSLAGTLPPGVKTSESNVFYHKGQIYLAAKVEDNSENNPNFNKKRVVFTTNDNGKTWTQVFEDFIPDNAAKCETSSLSLSNDVYLVGYTIDSPYRNGIYITTNTGKSIKLFDRDSKGYTSMSQDEDNLYILFEGSNEQNSKDEGDILFRRFDISAKEYANINAQILNRGTNLLDLQNKLFASRSYLTGEYATQDNSGVEAVILNNNYKIGAFYKNSKENSKDLYRTIEYNTKDTTLVLSQDNIITNNDNIFAGYQYTKLNYLNGSKNDINSFVVGYSLNSKFENDIEYNFGINGIYSNNKLQRNKNEGLGKSASFDSYSISLKNELYKNLKIEEDTNFDLAIGLKTTYFSHDKISEKNGNGFNDAYIKKSQNLSNEVYIKANAEHNIRVTEKFNTKVGAHVGYSKELMNVDNWRDTFTILDVEKKYARPVEKHSAGITNAGFYLTLDFSDKIETTLAYNIDSTGEGVTSGKLTYKF